jgi:DNA-binding SARP family transcriptional activator
MLARFAPVIFIQTLGTFRVIRDGLPVPIIAWKSKKARELVKILIARRGPTPHDQLMELLWPAVDPARASIRLSALLAAVREVLQPQPIGEGPLVATGGAVSLNRTQVSIDVENFLTQATAALDAHRAEEPGVITRIETAVAAHTGDFLAEDPYQEWARPLAEEVRAVHISLLQALAARSRKADDADAVVRYTLRLLEQDCYDEEAHLNLVGILIDAGRLGEARRHYQT